MSSTPTSQHTSTKIAPNAPVKKKKYIKTKKSQTAINLSKLRKSKTFRNLGDALDYFSD